MELSQKDRLFLSNQYRLLAMLAEHDSDREEFETCQQIVERGYSHFYYKLGPFLDGDDWDADAIPFVMELLDMFRALTAYKSFHRDEEVVNNDRSVFRGFDGNNESGYYAITRFVFERLNLFEESRRADLNTHYPALDGYRRMLATWQGFGRPHELSRDQARAIVAA